MHNIFYLDIQFVAAADNCHGIYDQIPQQIYDRRNIEIRSPQFFIDIDINTVQFTAGQDPYHIIYNCLNRILICSLINSFLIGIIPDSTIQLLQLERRIR